ncbi:MAG: TetR family transcriptional regulator [Actinomycetota bacterium]|nr:TetR family transcriptional regulator [Actinomycetota bacterium]
MSSIHPTPGDSELTDDRTTRARIRDAAMACFAEYGTAATTARKIADAAGVSAGLVIHHFGSMEGVRSACDEYVVSAIRRHTQKAMSTGPDVDVLAALREPGVRPLMGYLASVLADDSATVAKLVDNLVDDAEAYMEQGVKSGKVRPAADLRGRAVMLTIWSLGELVLHEHVERLTGVDLTDPEVLTTPSFAKYAGLVYQIYGEGIFTEAFTSRALVELAEVASDQDHRMSRPPDEADSSEVTRSGGT